VISGASPARGFGGVIFGAGRPAGECPRRDHCQLCASPSGTRPGPAIVVAERLQGVTDFAGASGVTSAGHHCKCATHAPFWRGLSLTGFPDLFRAAFVRTGFADADGLDLFFVVVVK